jgi:hypothetical protein
MVYEHPKMCAELLLNVERQMDMITDLTGTYSPKLQEECSRIGREFEILNIRIAGGYFASITR